MKRILDSPLLRCRQCGHVRDAHQHLRRGTDCSACECKRYHKPRATLRQRLLALDRLVRRPRVGLIFASFTTSILLFVRYATDQKVNVATVVYLYALGFLVYLGIEFFTCGRGDDDD